MSEENNEQFGELLHEDRLFPPPDRFRDAAHVKDESPYLAGSEDFEAFWADQAASTGLP